MKNITITIFFLGNSIHEYVTDIIPNSGDMIELPDHNRYIVTDRVFVASKNRVKLLVESLML